MSRSPARTVSPPHRAPLPGLLTDTVSQSDDHRSGTTALPANHLLPEEDGNRDDRPHRDGDRRAVADGGYGHGGRTGAERGVAHHVETHRDRAVARTTAGHHREDVVDLERKRQREENDDRGHRPNGRQGHRPQASPGKGDSDR